MDDKTREVLMKNRAEFEKAYPKSRPQFQPYPKPNRSKYRKMIAAFFNTSEGLL